MEAPGNQDFCEVDDFEGFDEEDATSRDEILKSVEALHVCLNSWSDDLPETNYNYVGAYLELDSSKMRPDAHDFHKYRPSWFQLVGGRVSLVGFMVKSLDLEKRGRDLAEMRGRWISLFRPVIGLLNTVIAEVESSTKVKKIKLSPRNQKVLSRLDEFVEECNSVQSDDGNFTFYSSLLTLLLFLKGKIDSKGKISVTLKSKEEALLKFNDLKRLCVTALRAEVTTREQINEGNDLIALTLFRVQNLFSQINSSEECDFSFEVCRAGRLEDDSLELCSIGEEAVLVEKVDAAA
jgi:hypothetical protein